MSNTQNNPPCLQIKIFKYTLDMRGWQIIMIAWHQSEMQIKDAFIGLFHLFYDLFLYLDADFMYKKM